MKQIRKWAPNLFKLERSPRKKDHSIVNGFYLESSLPETTCLIVAKDIFITLNDRFFTASV